MAVLLQNGNLKPNIAMNLDMGKKFIRVLKKKNIIQNSKFLQSMVEALEEQLNDEVDMRTEAVRFAKANEIAQQLNADLKNDLRGWEIKVPKLITDMPLREDLAFYEVVEGVPFDSLSEAKQAEYGELILKANLKSLFRYGWFDPDRHKGNIMINEKSKKIWFLDYGQFTSFSKSKNPFKWDPRLTLAHFMMALKNKNAKEIVYYAQMMSGAEGALTQRAQQILIADLNLILQKNQDDLKEQTLAIITKLMDDGIKLESNYLFGALKGLIILYGEKYADSKTGEDRFAQIVEKEIVEVLAKKAPVVIANKAKLGIQTILSSAKDKLSGSSKVLRCEALFGF